MKAIKCMVPLFLFMFIGFLGQAQVTAETTVKNTKTEKASCQKTCAPAACKALVKAGLCTPEQAAKCQKTVKTASVQSNVPFATEVAAVSQSRTAKDASKSKKATCAKAKQQCCSVSKKEE